MRTTKTVVLSSIAISILTGCASAPPIPIFVNGMMSAPSAVPGTKRLSTTFTKPTIAGNPDTTVPDLFIIRECYAGQCAEGVVKTTVVLAVENVSANNAQVHVTVHGDIGPRQTLRSQTPVSTTETTGSVGHDVPVITDQFSEVREALLPFGQIKQIPLPHGLRAHLCVARSINGMSDGSCNFTPLQLNEGMEASTPLL